MAIHTILIAEDAYGWDDDGENWRSIPNYVLEGVEVFHHIADLEAYESDILACLADRPDLFEILYWGGDVL